MHGSPKTTMSPFPDQIEARGDKLQQLQEKIESLEAQLIAANKEKSLLTQQEDLWCWAVDAPESLAADQSTKAKAGQTDDGLWLWLAPSVESEKPLLATTPKALNPRKWLSFPLIEREDLNHDTRRYRFALPVSEDGQDQQLGLPVGQHVMIKATVGGKPVIRAYTPLGHGLGYVDFVIKAYFPSLPRFPAGGLLTMHMEKLEVGDALQFKGPIGEFIFECDEPAGSPPAFTVGSEGKTTYRSLGFIAGGSGITPCLQVANAVVVADLDVTVHLLCANKTPADVLCMADLEQLASDPRVHVWHTVSKAADDTRWPFSTGCIDEAMLRAHMPPPGERTHVLMCGPRGMIDEACKPNLRRLGFEDGHLHVF